jgi:hypothetical protein
MTQKELIRMAREAGWSYVELGIYQKLLGRFAALAAAHEREACAEIADEMVAWDWNGDDIADAIRARGESK